MESVKETSGLKLNAWFDHGLGDVLQVIPILEIYRRRGFDVKVHYEGNKRCAWDMAGLDFIPVEGAVYHPWKYYSEFNVPRESDTGHGNKVYGNLFVDNPWPSLGDPDEVWEEICQVKLERKAELPQDVVDRVDAFVSNLPKPIVLLHSKGTNFQQSKSIQDSEVEKLYRILLDAMPGSIVLMDWDYRVPKLAHARMRHIKDELGHIDLETLLALYDRADLLIGVDSGPYHFAAMSNLPVLGVFHHHYPACVALPRENTLNLTRESYRPQNIARRRRWNIVEYPGNLPTSDQIAAHALRMLAGCRYLSDQSQIARDVQLQQMVRDWSRQATGLSRYADRNNTTDWLFCERLRRFPDACRIVETGCIRSREDWSAGYSTYLFAMLADADSGVSLLSIDNDSSHVETAKQLVSDWRGQVEFRVSDSIAGLNSLSEPVDILFLDSWDSDAPGHAEHGLAEIIAAESHLHERSIVVYDDTVWDRGGWKGKGALGVPYLLKRGWKIAASGYQVILVRDDSPKTATPEVDSEHHRYHDVFVRTNFSTQDKTVVDEVICNDGYKTSLRPTLGDGEIVVDIGAHIGAFAKLWHKKNPKAKIICVEACPENIPTLRKNCGEFATIIQAACVYMKSEAALLNSVCQDTAATGGSFVVPVESMPTHHVDNHHWRDARQLRKITIEEIMSECQIERIDVLKLDCEGSEFSILGETTSLEKVSLILGEYHGAERWNKLLSSKFSSGWRYALMWSHEGFNGGLGIFHLESEQSRYLSHSTT